MQMKQLQHGTIMRVCHKGTVILRWWWGRNSMQATFSEGHKPPPSGPSVPSLWPHKLAANWVKTWGILPYISPEHQPGAAPRSKASSPFPPPASAWQIKSEPSPPIRTPTPLPLQSEGTLYSTREAYMDWCTHILSRFCKIGSSEPDGSLGIY
jgi:hypothetical protein